MGIDPRPDWFQDLVTSGNITTHIYGDGVVGGEFSDPFDHVKAFCLVGHIRAEYGDYIVQAPNGEIFVRPPEFFEKGYVLIDTSIERQNAYDQLMDDMNTLPIPKEFRFGAEEKRSSIFDFPLTAFLNFFFPKNEGELLPKTDLRIPMPPVKPPKDEESGDAIAPYKNALLFPIYLEPNGEIDENTSHRFDVWVFPSESEMYRFNKEELGSEEENPVFTATACGFKLEANPLLGCILFCHPHVSVEMVVHESTHAALRSLRRLNCLDIGEKPNESEERLAELVSSFATQISDKLHEYGAWR